MFVVQGARMVWANPCVRQATTTVVIEQVIPAVVSVTNERIAPVVKRTVEEKVIPAVKTAKSKVCIGLSDLKKHTVSRAFSESSEVFVATEQQSEEGAGRFVSASRGLDEKFLPTWMPM